MNHPQDRYYKKFNNENLLLMAMDSFGEFRDADYQYSCWRVNRYIAISKFGKWVDNCGEKVVLVFDTFDSSIEATQCNSLHECTQKLEAIECQ